MDDPLRIGVEPPPAPPPRSGKLIAVLAVLLLLGAAGAWLAGSFRGSPSPTSTVFPPSTTTTTAGPTTTGPTTTALPSDRVAGALTFWTALGTGDAAGALAAVPRPAPGAADLIGFVAAFSPRFTVTDCTEVTTGAVECLVTVTDENLLAVGGRGGQGRLSLSEDGRIDVAAAVASAASRLSLHALNLHTEALHAACPLTDAPATPGLAIVGSPTAACGAYLADLIPEYLGEPPPAGGRP